MTPEQRCEIQNQLTLLRYAAEKWAFDYEKAKAQDDSTAQKRLRRLLDSAIQQIELYEDILKSVDHGND